MIHKSEWLFQANGKLWTRNFFRNGCENVFFITIWKRAKVRTKMLCIINLLRSNDTYSLSLFILLMAKRSMERNFTLFSRFYAAFSFSFFSFKDLLSFHNFWLWHKKLFPFFCAISRFFHPNEISSTCSLHNFYQNLLMLHKSSNSKVIASSVIFFI